MRLKAQKKKTHNRKHLPPTFRGMCPFFFFFRLFVLFTNIVLTRCWNVAPTWNVFFKLSAAAVSLIGIDGILSSCPVVRKKCFTFTCHKTNKQRFVTFITTNKAAIHIHTCTHIKKGHRLAHKRFATIKEFMKDLSENRNRFNRSVCNKYVRQYFKQAFAYVWNYSCSNLYIAETYSILCLLLLLFWFILFPQTCYA